MIESHHQEGEGEVMLLCSLPPVTDPIWSSRNAKWAGKDLFVFGSADLSTALIRHGLFDEYRIGLVPVTLGEGNPLFKGDSEPLRLELLQSRPLGDCCLLLRYRPADVAAAAD